MPALRIYVGVRGQEAVLRDVPPVHVEGEPQEACGGRARARGGGGREAALPPLRARVALPRQEPALRDVPRLLHQGGRAEEQVVRAQPSENM